MQSEKASLGHLRIAKVQIRLCIILIWAVAVRLQHHLMLEKKFRNSNILIKQDGFAAKSALPVRIGLGGVFSHCSANLYSCTKHLSET